MAEPDHLLTQEEIEQRSVALAKQLRGQSSELRKHRRFGEGFKRRLAETWSEPLYLYEVVLLTVFDAGSEFTQKHWAQAVEEHDFAFEALTLLHARACLVGGEVLELLKGGYPHGAEARCRTIHELAVFAGVIGEHPEVAEKFLAHAAVEDSNNMDTYQAKLAGRAGYEPMSQEEIDENHARKAAALKRFGDSFKGRYGWAVDLFPPQHPPTFGKLEELARLDHLRPFYDWATHLGVHASSRGVRLNVIDRGGVGAPLAGPTNVGLAEPGHGALISLGQVTTSLLVHGRPITGDPTPVVILKALLKLTDEAGKAFHDADKRLEDKEARFQQVEARRATGGVMAKLLGWVAPRWRSRNPR